MKRNLQLHLYVIFSKLNKIMSFSVGYVKKVLKRQDTDLCRFSMFIPEKFDAEMTESSGINVNES